MKLKRNAYTIFMICLTMLILGCSGGKMEEKKVSYDSIKDVPEKVWNSLSEKKIYFGHQSVGLNIIEGIEDLKKEYQQIKLNILELSGHDIQNGAFAHSAVGKNKEPDSKLNEFVTLMNDGLGKSTDIAALKFCYVDINKDTDVQSMFENYKNAVEKLRHKYSNVTIIHFTSPLKTQETSWKTWLKKTIGRKNIWEYDANIKRNEYNELVRETYKGKEPIFDLAELESTKSDGSRSTFELNDKTYFSLAPEYTYDGGHLNEKGRKQIAGKLLLMLANL